jgi:hypothetical protein
MAGRRSRKAASHVARMLRKPGTTKATRSVALSALAQASHGGQPSPRDVRLMRRSGFTAVTRSVAASALTQRT